MTEINNEEKVKFSLDSFIQANKNMVYANNLAYKDWGTTLGSQNYGGQHPRDYTSEEVRRILLSNNAQQQAKLSRTFFATNGFYKRIILHYSTLLKYVGVLIPNPAFGKSLQDNHVSRRYYQAANYLDTMNIPHLATKIALSVLIDGSYYGVIQSKGKQAFSILDLPHSWCRSNFRDKSGKDIVEFNVAYFNSIRDERQRRAALSTYPEEIASYYKAWSKDKSGLSAWMFIPVDMGIYFDLFEPRPLFLQIIPATLEYDDTVAREAERELEEIKKILVQKIPHLNNGELLFEPIEAEEIHKGSVNMLRKSNPHISVLTTYTDVDSIVSSTSSENMSKNNIEKMKGNIYNETGATSQVFATTGSVAAELSLKNDLALMMELAKQYNLFITDVVNSLFANANIDFKYMILPVSWYNESAYINDAYKMINTGYSMLVPAVAQGFSQSDFHNLKILENDLLEITEQLIPPRSSATGGGEEGPGRPELPPEQRTEKTNKNREAIAKGGSGDE